MTGCYMSGLSGIWLLNNFAAIGMWGGEQKEGRPSPVLIESYHGVLDLPEDSAVRMPACLKREEVGSQTVNQVLPILKVIWSGTPPLPFNPSTKKGNGDSGIGQLASYPLY